LRIFKTKWFDRFTRKNDINNSILIDAVKRAISLSVFEENNTKILEEEKYIQGFISDTPIHRLFLNVNGEEIHLSMQEFKCLAWLSRGKTIKEVARIMNLSPRTVESYLDNVKLKTKIESRSKLIDLFVLNFYKDNCLV